MWYNLIILGIERLLTMYAEEETLMMYYIDIDRLPMIRFAGTDSLQPPHRHIRRKPAEYILYFIQSGVMYLKEADREYALEAGDMILLDPAFIHEGTRTSNCTYSYVHFRHDAVRRTDEELPLESLIELRQKSLSSAALTYEQCGSNTLMLPKYHHFSNMSTFAAIVQRVDEIRQRHMIALEHYKQLAATVLVEILIRIERCYISSVISEHTDIPSRTYHTVQNVLAYLNHHYTEKLSGDGLAKEFSMNYDYLNRIFKSVMRMSIFQYLTSLRMEQAKVYLATTGYSVGQIGAFVGYPDEYYFCRIFKKYSGQTPREYSQRQAV